MSNGVQWCIGALVVLILIVLLLWMRPPVYIPVAVPMAPVPSATVVPKGPEGPKGPVYRGTTMTYQTAPLTQLPAATLAPTQLSRYYTPARPSIPTDYTLESCPCPYRKPQKTDLPVPNIHLCGLLNQSSYQLSEFR